MAVRVTGRIQIGRFVFEVGAPEGTRADLATAPGGAEPGQLALALGQPGPTEIIGAAEPQPRLLNRVVRLAHRAQHPVGHGAQVGSVLFEPLGPILALGHWSHLLARFRHGSDGRTAGSVTQGGTVKITQLMRWQGWRQTSVTFLPRAPSGWQGGRT